MGPHGESGERFEDFSQSESLDYHPRSGSIEGVSHGEDGIAGISDEDQQLCFALPSGTERPIIKERLFD
jgi:hypothetical protein